MKIKPIKLLLIITIIFILVKLFRKNFIENFSNEIQNTIIQTYYDKDKIPKKVFDNIKKFAPNYKHIIFDDDECVKFIKKYFKPTILETFKKLKGPHKADLFRYCYLYKFGGVYLDIKTELIKPLDNIIKKDVTYSVLSIVRNTVYQGVLASPSGNPIFLKLIKFMIEIVKEGDKIPYLIFTRDFYRKVGEDCKIGLYGRLYEGYNINIKNKNNYYFFTEKCSKNKKQCRDGLDRYGLCCFIFDDKEKIFKTRYSDFPW